MKFKCIPAVLSLLLLAAGCSSAPAKSAAASSSAVSKAEPDIRSEESRSESSSSSPSLSENAHSSAERAESMESLERPASMTPEAADAARNNPVLNAAPLANFEDLKKAFSDQGFTIHDEKAEGMDLQFTAENDSGTVQVQAGLFENGDGAQKAAEQRQSALEHEGYQAAQTQSSPSARLTTLVNDFNSEYGYIGLDRQSNRLYTFSSVLDGNRDQCIKVLQALGFTGLQSE